jgi:hypothetical protein
MNISLLEEMKLDGIVFAQYCPNIVDSLDPPS